MNQFGTKTKLYINVKQQRTLCERNQMWENMLKVNLHFKRAHSEKKFLGKYCNEFRVVNIGMCSWYLFIIMARFVAECVNLWTAHPDDLFSRIL